MERSPAYGLARSLTDLNLIPSVRATLPRLGHKTWHSLRLILLPEVLGENGLPLNSCM